MFNFLQVQKWLSFHSQDPTSPHNGGGATSLLDTYKPELLENNPSPLFRESPKNDMLLDLTRIRLKGIEMFLNAQISEILGIARWYSYLFVYNTIGFIPVNNSFLDLFFVVAKVQTTTALSTYRDYVR